jgi:type II secretory pathway component PulK
MSNRKGMALILVLVMSALIGVSAMLLFSTVNLEMMIAGNKRRHNQAKISAASGLNHFTALGLDYNTLRGRAGGLQTLQVLPLTRLSDKTSYEVKVYFSPRLNERQYMVESIGYYTKGDKIISSHPIKAMFEGGQ